MKKTDYFIGLDIGTDSVGWAVTDTDYNILKTNSKAMWGIHLFESGKTAEERRLFRTARRRTDRYHERINLLNEFFSPEICKVDPNFFVRLKESKFFLEDKKIAEKYTLFNDENYTDIDFHKEFPTIYHLRNKLISCEDKCDIRLVYLAVAHIIKHRGHFLFEDLAVGDMPSFENVFNELKQVLYDYDIDFSVSNTTDIEKILKDRKASVNDKKKILKQLFSANDASSKAVCDLLAGGTVKLSAIFKDNAIDDSEKITFKNGYEEKENHYQELLGDDFYLIEKIKSVYDWSILSNILSGYRSISAAKIAVYEKHQKDLSLLKSLFKKYAPENYKDFFSNNKKACNYNAYVGHATGTKAYLSSESKNCTQEDMCKLAIKLLPEFEPENEDEEYIKNELSNYTALPKQTTKDNSVIPYQINLYELQQILDTAANHYDFLNESDGVLTVKEKIERIFSFRIPYYVGPLNSNSKNAWLVRKEPGKITPWNFNDKVDTVNSAGNFISRMTNMCTYLVGEPVLPKESILYSKYSIYALLNNILIDGTKLSVNAKNQLFKDLYLNVEKPKKMTAKMILKYLINTGYCSKDSEISGIDNDIPITMRSYVSIKNIIGNKIDDIEMVEDIIYQITVLGESKDLLSYYLQKSFSDKLSEKEIKELLRLKFSGWGRFSKELLTGIYHIDKATGECISIMTALENTQSNFMQLLSTEYDFADAIEEFNSDKNNITEGLSYNTVDNLYVSPAVKRSIWRTTLIVKEIVKIAGHEPKKIFIEMARDNTDDKKGQRTLSRKAKLLESYKKCDADIAFLKKSLEDISDENTLRSDKLFLYYSQLGRCMYSGDPIDLKDLFNDNMYDIDHIYPQSKTKDDSLDNRVLVKRVLNEEKKDKYPIPSSFKTDCTKALWAHLEKVGLITKEKYNRLKRTEAFSDAELSGFIARQMVETRQSTKAVANLLKTYYTDTKIVYVKAGNVSDFRQKFDIVKCRSVNDYHHAKDAYLNIVVGNVYDVKFGSNPIKFIESGNKYSLNKIYDYDVKLREKYAWIHNQTIKTVKRNVMKNNILFTRYATEQKGGFFDQMPVKHGNGQMPLKTSDERLADFNKYGGYNKIAGAYFALIRYSHKGKTVTSFESVPIYLVSAIENDASELKNYFSKEFDSVEILLPKVKINTLFCVDGFKMHLSGRTGNQLIFKGAEQLTISKESYEYFKRIDKYIERNKKAKSVLPISSLQKINQEDNLVIYDIFTDKLKNSLYNKRLSSQINSFENGREIFISLTLEEQCQFLYNAISLFRCTPGTADLKLIKGSANAGMLLLNKKVDSTSDIKIINQSITGIFENVLVLSKL